MSGLFCPNCGEQHTTKGQYCSYCGEDLKDAILEYKDKRLPVKLNYNEKESKAEPQEEIKKYPTGSPLPKATRAGQDTGDIRIRSNIFLDILSGLCIGCS